MASVQVELMFYPLICRDLENQNQKTLALVTI